MKLFSHIYIVKKKYQTALIILVSIITFISITIYSGILAAGSYPYSQSYGFYISRDSLTHTIKRFKAANISYNPPKRVGLVDGLDENGNFYNCWIYYREQNKIVFFVVVNDPENKYKSSIWLVSVNDGITLGRWHTVNDDFNRRDNKKAKTDFEDEFLKKLKLSYQDNGNGMFVFWK